MNILKSFKRHCKLGFPGVTSGEETTCQCRVCNRCRFDPCVGKIPREGNANPLQYSCQGNPMERNLAGYSSWGHKESDTTECTHTHVIYTILGSPGDSGGEESAWNAGDSLQFRRCSFIPWVRKIPWRREWHPTSVFLLGKFLGLRSLGGYSPWGHKKFDIMDQLMLSLSFFMYNSKLGAVYSFGFFLNM